MKTPTRRKGRPKGFYAKTEVAPVQSLDRAMIVLEALADSAGLTLTEIAERLDQSPATIYRVLNTLNARGIVESDPQTQAWHIGPMAFRLGSAFLRRTSVVDRSRPEMRQLMEITGETANLGIEKDGLVMFLSQVETHETIRAFFPPGTLSPMHASGIGKALLSRYSDDRLDRFLRSGTFEAFTSKTLCEPEAIRKDMQGIREAGFAVDDEEKTTGMRCVAAPILDFYNEPVAGISVSGPSHRLTPDRISEIGKAVKQAANQISRGLGSSET
ncbi:HTH-type transcriptional regulator BhcR [Parasedimentitalea maritima]|uniref:Helix-turn-helix domain-containing protein n=1 Tax=Parasedimentitalea maritima TaxID=2578117 RepID=A0A6A4R8V1_9RHOB|nr:HTH-type transcriptional regulator BhcR [Zongyanglinia marina]KAE9628578.1 helix-turn-helix domain-containing protein [Zongyanglinia marina]